MVLLILIILDRGLTIVEIDDVPVDDDGAIAPNTPEGSINDGLGGSIVNASNRSSDK
jgi:hypothetical protein